VALKSIADFLFYHIDVDHFADHFADHFRFYHITQIPLRRYYYVY